MTGRPGALVLPVLVAALLLTGCAASPADARRDSVAALTVAANDRDAAAVRERADALLLLVRDQLARQQVPADEAERLLALAESVRAGADAIDPEVIERRRAEQQARQALEEAQRELAEQRAAAEQAAREAEQAAREAEQAGGSGGGTGAAGGDDKDEDEDKDEDKDDGGDDKGKGDGEDKGKDSGKDG